MAFAAQTLIPTATSGTAPASAAPTAGATYKLIVRSAEEAVSAIREQLGENARVLSVRQVPGQGLAGLLGRPRLEVIAQVPTSAEEPAAATAAATAATAPHGPRSAAPAAFSAASLEPATPDTAPASASAFSAHAAHSALTTRSAADAPSSATAATATPSALGRHATVARAASHSTPDAADHASAPSILRGRDVPTGLSDLLRRSGFSAGLIGRLESGPEFAAQAGKPLHHLLVDVGQNLAAAANRRGPRPLPATVAFLGSPGAGRTTALCKWLGREVFTRRRTGRVFKAELDRPNPTEGLAVFCEALGLVLEHAASDTALPREENTFACVDMPAISVRRPRDNSALRRLLDTQRVEGRVLVLNALYDLSVLRDTYAAGRDLGATHVVFTHLDELEHWGRLWDFLIEGELSPLFLSTGAGLTGDFVPDVVSAVLRRTLPGASAPAAA